MKLIWCLDMLDLQLFEGDGAGAAASGADGAAGSETGVNEQAAAEPAPKHPRRVDRNPLAGVKYGKQPVEAEPTPQPAEPAAEPSDDWNDIRNNRYKEQFDRDVQEIVKKRLGSAKDAEAKLNSLMPMLDALVKKNGLQAGDYDALSKAVMDDDSLYE